ncbi:hypothetical protein [Dactylosporangium salmoneum]|uniref:Uncharacterized protein n=1 Tax=Dactylosporangium salmoneum TaxID=53361 RepID=A0ABP5TRV3_9ACTN
MTRQRIVILSLAVIVGLSLGWAVARLKPSPQATGPAAHAQDSTPPPDAGRATDDWTPVGASLKVRTRGQEPGTWWVLALAGPLPATAEAAGSTCSDAYYWTLEHGGAQTADFAMVLEVKALADTDVRIDRIAGRLTGHPAETGTMYADCGTADTETPPGLTGDEIWLSNDPQNADAVLGPDEGLTAPLPAGEVHRRTLHVMQAGGPEDSLFVLDIGLVVDGRAYQITLDDHGKPFRLRKVAGGIGFIPAAYHWRPAPTPGFSLEPSYTRSN